MISSRLKIHLIGSLGWGILSGTVFCWIVSSQNEHILFSDLILTSIASFMVGGLFWAEGFMRFSNYFVKSNK